MWACHCDDGNAIGTLGNGKRDSRLSRSGFRVWQHKQGAGGYQRPQAHDQCYHGQATKADEQEPGEHGPQG